MLTHFTRASLALKVLRLGITGMYGILSLTTISIL